MILTEKFVFVHMPKTGGTFVSQMVGQIYGQALIKSLESIQNEALDFSRPLLRMATFKHATRKAIPQNFLDKPILGCVRNPFDRYVSQYRFGSWKVASTEFYPGVRDHRSYPDLSFSEYVELANKQLWTVFNSKPLLDQSIGWQTACFIKWYCQQELHDLLRQGVMITEDLLREYSEPVRFIHTEKLNEELYTILKSLGYRESDIRFIRNSPKIIPEGASTISATRLEVKNTTVEDKDLERTEDYFSPELTQFIREKERLLFQLFPEWNNEVSK